MRYDVSTAGAISASNGKLNVNNRTGRVRSIRVVAPVAAVAHNELAQEYVDDVGLYNSRYLLLLLPSYSENARLTREFTDRRRCQRRIVVLTSALVQPYNKASLRARLNFVVAVGIIQWTGYLPSTSCSDVSCSDGVVSGRPAALT